MISSLSMKYKHWAKFRKMRVKIMVWSCHSSPQKEVSFKYLRKGVRNQNDVIDNPQKEESQAKMQPLFYF